MRKYKALVLILIIILIANLFACDYGRGGDIKVTPEPRDTSLDTSLSDSMLYANDMANLVQAYFTKPDRNSYTMQNQNVELVHELDKANEKSITSITTKDGKEYLKGSMDVFIEDKAGTLFYASNSTFRGRMNTTRFGFYYYETHIRELGFAKDGIDKPSKSLDISNFKEENWEINSDIKGINFKSGKMEIEIADGHDPYISQTGLRLDTSEYTGIELRLKTDGKTGLGEVFFATLESPHYSSDKRGQFQLKDSGNYNTYIVDLQGLDTYTGTIIGIRIDVGYANGEKISFEYIKAIATGEISVPYKLDKTLHIYSDKVHQEFRALAVKKTAQLKSFGYELKLEKSKVAKIEIKDKNGQKNDLSNIDGPSVEYVAFDIKGVGILGIIIPLGGYTERCDIFEEGPYYVLRQYARTSEEEPIFGNRLYTDEDHDFSGIRYAATIERNPLTKINVNDSNSNAKFVGYDYLVGAYKFFMEGSNFNQAYYNEPDKHYFADIEIEGDIYNRNFYVWSNSNTGALESAALLDDTRTQIPIPLQVCKNFCGEIEEPFYDPADTAYGDTFFPLKTKANEKLSFTLLHLYQNWGLYPLKQLSSIQFHISYYHLSTGVTESNCIAPYYVYGKDGWVLPDFRGASGIMWPAQPQFNSIGRLYFLSYLDGSKKYMSEYTDSYIRSANNTYVDLDYNYISDCGSFKYSLRHVEFPQLDENRVYYTLELEFLKKLTINDVRNDFSLFSFDGRHRHFIKTGYLNENNELSVDDINVSEPNTVLYKLGKEYPYFSYFDLVDGDDVMNFAFLIKSSEITIGGKKFNGNFVYKNYFDGKLNNASLSLDLGKTTFKKGDKIKIDFILLPYGSHLIKDDENLRTVREDSAIKALKLDAIKGESVADDYIPRIKAIDNEAEFTITGGKNNNTVRVDGFTNIKRPTIYELVDGSWQEYIFYVNDYDGYTIHYNIDGTYSFSFVFNQKTPDDSKTFKISN